MSLDIKDTKDALFERIKGLISVLSHLPVALTNTVASLDRDKHDVLYKRTADHKNSIETKIERLKLHMKKWEQQIASITRKGIISNLSPINKSTHK